MYTSMDSTLNAKKQTDKQRLTAFVDPALVKRAKVLGALEGLTISEVVEKALEVYAPKIESGPEDLIQLKFTAAVPNPAKHT
jgi:hypothetical protein